MERNQIKLQSSSPQVGGGSESGSTECLPGGFELKLPAAGAACDRTWPLSYGQERLWFLEQLEPGTAMYNMPCVARIGGRLDSAALEQALNSLAQRHEALRTSFVCEAEHPRQRIAPEVSVPLMAEDLMKVHPEQRQRLLSEATHREINRPFELTVAPLIRARLMRVAALEHVLMLTMHHIVSDEWSLKILLGELGKMYQQFSEGKPAALGDLPLQYRDFAASQRELFEKQTPSGDKQLSYWKKQLSGEFPMTELAATFPRRGI